MYFKFPCDHCGKNLKVSEENVGRKARCPYCHKAITVPQVTPADIPVATPRGKRGPNGKSQRSSARTQAEWSDGTNVTLLPSAMIGVVITIAFYTILFPFKHTYFGKLFIKQETGAWVCYALVYLMAWSVVMLFFKSRKLRRQKDAMLFDVLPTEISEDINVRTVDQFMEHIRSLPARASNSFLINRVLRGLEHFQVRKSNPEVATMMASQSEIDANSVQGSYTIVKVFIWAIPILGFIGTVVGISDAVNSFNGSMGQAQDISVLKESLNNVTGGLATAFDTTLVALVMSLLVSFPASSLQKSEEDLINWVDEYCNENLLKRLNDEVKPEGEGATPPAGDRQAEIRAVVDQALAAHHAEMEAWRQKYEAVGDAISRKVAEGWTQINEKYRGEQDERLKQINQMVAAVNPGAALVPQVVDEMKSAMTDLREQTQSVQSEIAGSMRASADALKSYFANLEVGLRSLNSVLSQLGDKQIKLESRESMPAHESPVHESPVDEMPDDDLPQGVLSKRHGGG
ncbi:MAG: hypothetical protein GC162_06955 [Planctomycetes bacterium]|nr:hypothetical protein [Planctomycetota bacterium]